MHITGGRKTEKEGVVSETKFEKRFTIGNNVETEKLTANLADGVLVLTAPKIEKKEKPVKHIMITERPHDDKMITDEKRSKIWMEMKKDIGEEEE